MKWAFTRVVGLMGLLGAMTASAQEPGAAGDTRGAARQFENPLPDLMTLRFINDVDMGVDGGREADLRLRMIALLPMRLTSHLNLVLQTTVPVRSMSPSEEDGERLNGIGNAVQHVLLGPTRAGRFLWAAGAVGDLPTATRRALSTGHLAVGPSVILSYQTPSWTLGLNTWHVQSVGVPAGVPGLARTHANPAVSYILPTRLSLGVGSEVVYNWNAEQGERLNVPLMATLTKTTQVGAQNINLTLAGRYFVARAPGTASWGVRLALAFNFQIDRDPEEG